MVDLVRQVPARMAASALVANLAVSRKESGPMQSMRSSEPNGRGG
jgi:hypothetical protein